MAESKRVRDSMGICYVRSVLYDATQVGGISSGEEEVYGVMHPLSSQAVPLSAERKDPYIVAAVPRAGKCCHIV